MIYRFNLKETLLSILLAIPLLTVTLLAGGGATVNILGIFFLFITYLLGVFFDGDRRIVMRWLWWSILIIFTEIVTCIIIKRIDLNNYIYYEMNKYIGLLLLIAPYPKKISSTVIIKVLLLFYVVINISNFIFIFLSGFHRVSSIFGSSYNTLAAFNLVGLPVLFFKSINLNHHERINKLWLIICQFLMYISIILSGSRIALPLLAIVGIGELLIMRKLHKASRWIIILIVIPVTAFFIFNSNLFSTAIMRFLSKDSLQDNVRMMQYTTALQIWKEGNILFGVGSPKAMFPISGYTYVHNFILETLLSSGIIGLILQMSYHYVAIKSTFSKINISVYLPYKLIVVLTIISAFGMAMFHPVMTSSMSFNYLYIISLIAIRRIIPDEQR